MSKKYKILVVDDNPDNIRVLVELLKNDYQLNATTSGFDAINYAATWQPDLILLDVMMPEISGYNVCIQLKSDPETQNIPIIFVTALSDVSEELLGLDLGAIDYITKPINPELVKISIKNHIKYKRFEDIINGVISNKTAGIDKCDKKNKILFEKILSRCSEFPNLSKFDQAHAYRCYEYVKLTMKKMLSSNAYGEMLTSDLPEAICTSALFHDIGKILDFEDINIKFNNLSELDIDKLKKHVLINDDLIKIIEEEADDTLLAETIIDAIKYHHEHWDGSGQPEKLTGNKIPLAARIIAIANYYDVSAGKADYKDQSFHFETLKILTYKSGKNFDPDIVNIFLKCQDELLEIIDKYGG